MTKRQLILLIVILILSVASRVAAAIILGDQVVSLPGTADQVSYHHLAVRVLEGHGFSFGENWWPATRAGEPTAHWSYLYTFYLVGVYALFGVHPVAARLIQAVLIGVLQPLLVYALGKRLFGLWAGLAAAAIHAGYLYFIYYAGTLMTEPAYITALLVSMFLTVILVDQAGRQPAHSRGLVWPGVLFSLAIGFTVMLRQLFMLLIPFMLLWMWWANRRQRGASLWPAWIAAAVVGAMLILPFTAYNYARFDRFVLLNTNAGFAFFWGNHPVHGTHFISASEMESYRNLIPPELRSLDEAALDQALLKVGLGFIAADPLRYLQLSLSRIPDYFTFWPQRGSGTLSNITRLGSFTLFLPLMLLGAGLWLWEHRQETLGELVAEPGTLFLGIALLYTAMHVLTWTLTRYRLPVDAILILFAGHAVVWIAEKVIRLVRNQRQIQPSTS